MTQWLLPVLAAVLGYVGHWAQTTLARRHNREDAQAQRVSALRDRLIELRNMDEAPMSEVTDQVSQLHNEATLLTGRLVRERVIADLLRINRAFHLDQHELSAKDVRKACTRDAIDCCTAVLRGEVPPEIGAHDNDYVIYLCDRLGDRNRSANFANFASVNLFAASPEEQAAREAWRREERRKYGRRRLLPRPKWLRNERSRAPWW
ncbi:hypothetical protein ACFVZD_41495 [Streptomyces sp. NPDC058287]|uniref:hypothetical protein n=1 Tax=unclassified Streptomyces TaxID=2593676 RepID=UPI0036E424CB